MKALIPTCYIPNNFYLSLLKKFDTVEIEKEEHFCKQTYRNRCTILSANGPLDLIIPVRKDGTHKRSTGQTRISYSERWQQQHWRSIASAYAKAPFFEDYAYHFETFYQNEFEFLCDFNTELTRIICDLLEINCELRFTTEFVPTVASNDFRQAFDPANRQQFQHPAYTQVFSDRFEFEKNLCAFDLIFNCGPESISYIG